MNPIPKVNGSAGVNKQPSAPGKQNVPRGLAELMRVGSPLPVPMTTIPSQLGGAPSASSNFMLHSGKNFATGGQVGPEGMNMSQSGVTPPGGQPVGNDQLQAELQRFIQQNPEAVAKIKDALMEAINMGVVTMEDINMAVQMALAAAQNPEMYPRLRQMAIQKGLATEEELPMEYDQGLVFTLLIAGSAVQDLGPSAGAGVSTPQAVQPQGAVPNYAAGGEIPNHSGDRAGVKDGVTINVSEGEYVIPAEVVHRKGTDFFDKLIGKDEKAKA